jgi:hypothetical protein
MGNVAHGLIVPGAVISQVPQVRQATLQFVQQFRVALREEPYSAEKKVLDCHFAATSLYNLCGGGLILQVAHSTPKPFSDVLFSISHRFVAASARQTQLAVTVESVLDRGLLATWSRIGGFSFAFHYCSPRALLGPVDQPNFGLCGVELACLIQNHVQAHKTCAAVMRNPEPPKTAVKRFVYWVRNLAGKAIFTAHPVAFDGLWIGFNLRRFTQERLSKGLWCPQRLFMSASLYLMSFAAGRLG